ncbi:MAG: FAD-dependent oxidoreductase [Oscillospiraceae bacterium]|nr:FAD-dependent oxidoreductase [Oscillospiraceae bacterium]
MSKKRVVIIGAGPAGLTAAYELIMRAGDFYEVLIMEAGDRVGGLAQNYLHRDKVFDPGAHIFNCQSEQVKSWVGSFSPLQGQPAYDELITQSINTLQKYGADPQIYDNTMLMRPNAFASFYKGKGVSLPLELSLENIQKLGIKNYALLAHDMAKMLFANERINSLESKLSKRFGESSYSQFYEGYFEKHFGIHPAELPANINAFPLDVKRDYPNPLELAKNLISKQKNKAQLPTFLYHKYGSGYFWNIVAREIASKGGKIFLNCPVKSIFFNGRRASRIICEPKGTETEVEADVFLSSLPLPDLIRRAEGISVPQALIEIAESLPYRSYVSVGLELRSWRFTEGKEAPIYPGAFMGNKKLPYARKVLLPQKGCRISEVQIFNNISPYLYARPHETIWMGVGMPCSNGENLWKQSDDALIKQSISELEMLGIINGRDVLDSCIQRIEQAFPGYGGSYPYLDRLRTYLDEFSNLFCIGCAGQHYYGGMDAAILSSIEAVSNIITGKKERNEIWRSTASRL